MERGSRKTRRFTKENRSIPGLISKGGRETRRAVPSGRPRLGAFSDLTASLVRVNNRGFGIALDLFGSLAPPIVNQLSRSPGTTPVRVLLTSPLDVCSLQEG